MNRANQTMIECVYRKSNKMSHFWRISPSEGGGLNVEWRTGVSQSGDADQVYMKKRGSRLLKLAWNRFMPMSLTQTEEPLDKVELKWTLGERQNVQNRGSYHSRSAAVHQLFRIHIHHCKKKNALRLYTSAKCCNIFSPHTSPFHH